MTSTLASPSRSWVAWLRTGNPLVRRLCVPAVALSSLSLLLAGTATGSVAAPDGAATGTTITVRTSPIADPIPSQIIGANHRWPKNGLGMWDADNDQPVPRIVELAKLTNLNLVRYPGGTVANLFDWKDAIGPQAERGCQVGGGFVGAAEPFDSTYGPDEHERFVEAIGGGTTIMANATSQTVQDASDYVEYMNADVGDNPNGGTDWAQVRADNGHPEPYGVHVWELGNELYIGNQVYWRSDDEQKRLRQYVFGGQQRQVNQPVGSECDHRETAAVSTGEPGQSFQVWYPPVVPDSQRVTVGGADWRPINDLSDAKPDARVYEFDAETGDIRFGDGRHGRIPAVGAAVRASYTSGPHPGFVDFYPAMKAVDPSIDICSTWEKVEFVRLMGDKHPYDCIGPHLYARTDVSGTPAEIHNDSMPLIDGVLGELTTLENAIAEHGPAENPPYLEVSEYGSISLRETRPGPPGWPGTVSTTLIHAGLLIGMIEHSSPLAISSNLNNETPRAGELFGGAPTFVDTARARMLRLASAMVGSVPVSNEITSNPDADGDFKALDVLTTRRDDGTIQLFVLNRDGDSDVSADVAVPSAGSGDITVHTLNGAELSSFNLEAHPDDVAVSTVTEPRTDSGFAHTFPAHSISLIEVPA